MTTTIYTFSHWQFDPHNGTLRNGDDVIAIEPQQANLLLLLINNKNKVVTRDQITSSIWHNIIVEDNTISKAITRLRQLLNDNAKSPIFIKTVPKRGYQFIAHVTNVQPSVESPSNVTAKLFTRLSFIFAICLLVALTWVILPVQLSHNQGLTTLNTIGTPVTFREGRDQNANFHPFEQRIVFNGRVENRFAIFEKQLNDASAREVIEVNSPLISPIWLPDGKHVVFSSIDQQGNCKLFKTTLTNPQAKEITQCLSDKPLTVSLISKINALFWQDNAGLWLYYWHEKRKEPLTIGIDNSSHTRLSPDGNLFATLYKQGAHSKISIFDRNGNELSSKTLNHSIDSLLWDQTSKSIYFLGQHPAKEILQWDLSDTTQVITTTAYGTISQIDDINHQGQLLFTLSAIDIDIALFNHDKSTTIVNSAFADYNAAMSPDSNTIAFASKRSGLAQILLKKGESTVQLSNYKKASYIYDLTWSPDSKKLLVKRNNQIYLYDLIENTETTLPFDAEQTKQWQWLSNTQIAYVNKETNTLFLHDLTSDNTELLKTHVSNAQLVDKSWYISDEQGSSVFSTDSNFQAQTLIADNLAGRDWLVYQNELYVFNINPSRVSKLTSNGELDILFGRLNPLSFKATSDFGFVFNQINSNEANIYMIDLNMN